MTLTKRILVIAIPVVLGVVVAYLVTTGRSADAPSVEPAENTPADPAAPSPVATEFTTHPAPTTGMLLTTVYDASGRPAPGVSARVVPGRRHPLVPPPERPLEMRAITGPDGRFELADLAFGAYTVWLDAGNAALRQTLLISPDRYVNETELRLKPAADFRGSVTDTNGAPVPGAEVGLAGPTPESRDATAFGPNFRVLTDADGRFLLSGIPAEPQRIYARSGDHAIAFTEAVDPGGEITIRLDPGYTLTGMVQLPEGVPVNQPLRLRLAGEFANELHDVRTAADGTFSVANLRPGTYRVYLDHSGFAFLPDTTVSVPSASPVELTAVRAAKLAGRVVYGDPGTPLPGAIVGVHAVNSPIVLHATTGSTGAYEVPGLEAGTYEVALLSAPGFAPPPPIAFEVRQGQIVNTASFQLDPLGQIAGHVVDESGQSVAGARIESPAFGDTLVWTFPDGSFLAPIVRQTETLQLAAIKAGDIGLSEPGSPNGMTIALAPGATLSGTAYDIKNQPLPTGEVAIEGGALPVLGIESLAIDNGVFRSPVLVPGTYRLRLGPTYTADTRNRASVNLEPGQHLDGVQLYWITGTEAAPQSPLAANLEGIAESASRISGRVLDPEGYPAADVVVQARVAPGDVPASARSKADGAYEILVPDGIYIVQTAADAFTNVAFENVASDTSGLELRLQPAATIIGRVSSAGRGPAITHFEVAVLEQEPTLPDWERLVEWTPKTSTTGEFVIENVQGLRPLVVAARAPGYNAATAPVAPLRAGAASSPISIVLSPASAIEGIVADQAGAPLRGASVSVVGQNNREIAATTSGPDGTFRFEGLPPGNVIVVASHAQFSPIELPVTVTEGQTVEITLTFGAGGVLEGSVLRGEEPIENAVIVIRRQDDRSNTETTRTGPEGAYSVIGVEPGEVEVSLHLPKEESTRTGNFTQFALIEDGQITTVDFRLPTDNSVVEGVVLIGGEAPERGQITLQITTEYGEEQTAVRLEPDGSYRADDISPGHVQATAFAAAGGAQVQRQTVEFELAPNTTVRQDFEFAATGNLHGTVTGFPDGRRGEIVVLQGEVRLSNPTPAEILETARAAVAHTRTAEDGTFRVDRLAPGTYTIIAWLAGAPGNPQDTYYLFAYFDIPGAGEFTIDLNY